MANFPGSVKTFTSRNTGDVIQPGHVNDLQDEVNAIEDGYLNGTARLNSSNSTLVSLSVTGPSTVGTLQAGASTVATLSAGASTVTTLSAGLSTLTGLDVVGGSTLGGPLVMRGIQSTTLSSGNLDNFNIASTANIVNCTLPAGGSTITGMRGGTDGRRVIFSALSTVGICRFVHENTGSSAENRFVILNGSIPLGGVASSGYPLLSFTYINNRWYQGW